MSDIDLRRADPEWPFVETCPECNGTTKCQYGHRGCCHRCNGIGKVTPAEYDYECPECVGIGATKLSHFSVTCEKCDGYGVLSSIWKNK